MDLDAVAVGGTDSVEADVDAAAVDSFAAAENEKDTLAGSVAVAVAVAGLDDENKACTTTDSLEGERNRKSIPTAGGPLAKGDVEPLVFALAKGETWPLA